MEHSVGVKDLKLVFDGKVVYDPLPQQRKFHMSPAKYRLLGGSAGGGKDFRLDTPLLTDSGWKEAGKIGMEDMLVAPDGTYTKILGIYPKKNRKMYRVTFSDGRWVDADAEHSWQVYSNKHGARDGWQVKTTEEILNEKGDWSVPLCEAVPGPIWEGPDPYICGLLLGDGTLTSDNEILYTIEKDIIDYLESKGWRSYRYDYQHTTMVQSVKPYRHTYQNFLGRISGENKRVPKELLLADPKTRLLVLQGLMDTDGHHDKPPHGGAGFTNKSLQLCEDVVYLVRSLGGKAVIKKVVRPNRMIRGYKTSDCYYRVRISHCGKFNPFRVKRKASRVNGHQLGGKGLSIVSIEKVEDGDGVCFTVEHPSHLFVAKDFIVTHNSRAVMAEAIMRSLKYDFPTTGSIFRKSFPELESTIIRGIMDMLPGWFYKYNQSQHVMTLKNGSIIEFCYAESDADVIRYQSREWDWIGIDELTHFSQFQWTYLMSRLRTVKPLNTKFFAGTNPGGRGHVFCRERWVTKNCADENYNPNDYDFIPAGVYDNPYIMESNPDYIENLKMLPEKERKQLLEGSWDISAGMFFTEWDYSKHVVEDFDVPEDWQLIMSWDDGTREARAVHIGAIDADQRVWIIWEYYKKGESLTDAAENIRRILKEKGYWGRIYKCVVDPSMKRTDSHTGLSSTEVLESMGFGFLVGSIELGNNKRVEGWRVMRTYLGHKPYEEPLLKFFKSCENAIRTIPQLIYYESRSSATSVKEDINSDSDDHNADAIRYLLMSLDRLPSRFESSTFIKVKRRAYNPHSRY